MVETQFYTFDFDSIVDNGRKGYRAFAKKLRCPDIEKYDMFRGSCNGIVCLSKYRSPGDFVLWNPFTGSVLNSNCLAIFGYDHVNDDYKLVKWYSGIYQLFAYSFKYKSWRTIRFARKLDLERIGSGYLPDECTFANGAMHWLVQKHPYETSFIFTFDLGTYEFQKIPCAPLPVGASCIKMRLSDLNGCLCLGYTIIDRTRRRSMDIWVMKEYGAKRHWNKLTCIDLPANAYLEAVAYSEKSGRKLMLLQRGWGELLMYDLENKSLRDLVVVDGREARPSVSFVCIGSFVSPLNLAID